MGITSHFQHKVLLHYFLQLLLELLFFLLVHNACFDQKLFFNSTNFISNAFAAHEKHFLVLEPPHALSLHYDRSYFSFCWWVLNDSSDNLIIINVELAQDCNIFCVHDS